MKRTLLLSFLIAVLSFGFLTSRSSAGLYRGVLAQEDENIPYEAYVFENGLSATYTFARIEAGQYRMDASANVFPAAKTYIETSLYNEGLDVTNLCLIKARRWDSNTLAFSTFQFLDGAWVASDGCSFFVEVVTYP